MSGLRLCPQGHANVVASRYCNQCGTPLPGGQDLLEKVVGDRYRIIRDIGHGGFGRTYLAEDINRFNEYCVLKELSPAVENRDSLEKAKELFIREAEVLYKLQHPQIPTFREWFTEPNRESMFLVQDYVEGPTYQDILRDRLKQGQTFSESEIVTLLQQILPVLSYIHGLGVIHRDLSPDNLICRNRDRLPVLIDFGGVKEVTASAARMLGEVASLDSNNSPLNNGKSNPSPSNPSVTLIGKPGYAPEEQMRRGQVSAGSDLYALGVTALVLRLGKDPADFYDAFHLTFDWRSQITMTPGLASILDKMLAHRISERYSSAQSVLDALTALGTLPTQSTPPQADWTVPPQRHWTTAPEGGAAVPQTVGTLETLVVAPAGTAMATVTPPAPAAASPQQIAFAGLGQSASQWLAKPILKLLHSVRNLLLLAGAAGLGWLGVRWWIQSQSFKLPSLGQPTTQNTPSTDTLSAAEQERKAQLRGRLEDSGVSSGFFNRLVNEAYYLQYPEQQGRLLGSGSADEVHRANWDRVGLQVLDVLEPLPVSVRDRLGRYGEGDRVTWTAQLQAAGERPGRWFERAEATLINGLPMYQSVDLKNTVALQVVYGITEQQIQEQQIGQ